MTAPEPSSLLVIACGALAREIEWLKRTNAWRNLSVKCLDAELHNHPDKIPEKLETLIADNHDQFDQMFFFLVYRVLKFSPWCFKGS